MADLQGNFVDATAGFTLKGVPVATRSPTAQGKVYAPVAWASPFGAVLTANSLYTWAVNIDLSHTMVGLQLINESVVSGNLKISLHSYDGATLLASSGSVAQAGTFVPQFVPFTTPVAVVSGTTYWISMIPDNATGKWQVAPALVSSAVVAQGGFTVPSTITPPTTTARGGNQPIMTTYGT